MLPSFATPLLLQRPCMWRNPGLLVGGIGLVLISWVGDVRALEVSLGRCIMILRSIAKQFQKSFLAFRGASVTLVSYLESVAESCMNHTTWPSDVMKTSDARLITD